MLTGEERLARLEQITREEEALDAEKRAIYRESLEDADVEAKVCADGLARLIAEREPPPPPRFPLKVTGFAYDDRCQVFEREKSPVNWVAVRPCEPELGGRTFLGVLIGRVALAWGCRQGRDGILHFGPCNTNPAIYVPDLGRLVLGLGSWWSQLRSADSLRAITDADIESIWYVRALLDLGRFDCAEGRHEWVGAGYDEALWQRCARGCDVYRWRARDGEAWTESAGLVATVDLSGLRGDPSLRAGAYFDAVDDVLEALVYQMHRLPEELRVVMPGRWLNRLYRRHPGGTATLQQVLFRLPDPRAEEQAQ